MSEAAAARARDLKAGQRVYVPRLKGWYSLAADAKTHRLSKDVIRLEFIQIPDPEYRHAADVMRVRPPRKALGGAAATP